MRLYAFITGIFLMGALWGQEDSFVRHARPDNDQDSAFLRCYGKYFIPSLYTIRHFSSFSIRDNQLKKQITYDPNITLGVGLCVSYSWIGLAGSMAFRFLNNDEALYGKTEKIDFYTNLYSKRFLYDLNFQYYKGYYVSNPQVINPSWTKGMPYPYRPDIQTITLGYAMYYSFNYKHFSLKAPYNYCDEQLRSAGSWIVGVFFSGYAMAATDSVIVPSYVEFNDSSRMRVLFSLDMGLSGGYAYTWVIKKHWFISGMLLPGLSFQHYKGYTNQYEIRYAGLSLKSQTRLAIGYSKPRFYFGWVIVFDAFNLHSTSLSTYKYKSGYTCFTIGTRIYPHRKHNKTD